MKTDEKERLLCVYVLGGSGPRCHWGSEMRQDLMVAECEAKQSCSIYESGVSVEGKKRKRGEEKQDAPLKSHSMLFSLQAGLSSQ